MNAFIHQSYASQGSSSDTGSNPFATAGWTLALTMSKTSSYSDVLAPSAVETKDVYYGIYISGLPTQQPSDAAWTISTHPNSTWYTISTFAADPYGVATYDKFTYYYQAPEFPNSAPSVLFYVMRYGQTSGTGSGTDKKPRKLSFTMPVSDIYVYATLRVYYKAF